ncbi:DoxX family protein, partial [Actinomadura sp. 7K507]|uniref:DoxX family protein n=1 Tax=Actinomadura sp. 7K507 TaxID=2530365 RepID=UPI001042EB15
MRTRPLYDIAAVLARVGVGVVFMAHGWQKIEAGVTATSGSFDDLGVPLPTAAAVYSAFVELLGGAALIAGLGLPITGALLFVDMVGAFVFVHAAEGLFLVDGTTVENGFELVLVLGMASLLFAAGGGGRLTVDQWIIRKRLARPEDDEGEEDAKSFVESLRQA